MPPELDAAWRDWRIVKLSGWTFAEIDAAAAVRLDHLLRIDQIVNETTEAEIEAISSGHGGGAGREWTTGGAPA